MISWLGNTFWITGPLCENPSVNSGLPSQRACNVELCDVLFDISTNILLYKQLCCQWHKMPDAHMMSLQQPYAYYADIVYLPDWHLPWFYILHAF